MRRGGNAASRISRAGIQGAVLASAVLIATIAAQAQIISVGGKSSDRGLAPSEFGFASRPAPISLLAVLAPSLGLSISTVNLSLSVTDPNTPAPTVRVPVTSFWHLGSSSTAVELVGYFDSPQRALADDRNHSIPSSRVLAALSGQPLMPFTESSSAGSAGGSRIFFRQAISRQNFSAWRSDSIEIRLDRIADLGAPSGIYRGVLHLRMIAY